MTTVCTHANGNCTCGLAAQAPVCSWLMKAPCQGYYRATSFGSARLACTHVPRHISFSPALFSPMPPSPASLQKSYPCGHAVVVLIKGRRHHIYGGARAVPNRSNAGLKHTKYQCNTPAVHLCPTNTSVVVLLSVNPFRLVLTNMVVQGIALLHVCKLGQVACR